MKKRVFGRQLNRDANERKALFKGLLESLVMLESIHTTKAKAQAIRGQAEKLITKAKVRGQESRQFLQPYLSPKAVEKVMNDLAVRFEKRPGGYTRIIKLGTRFADNAEMAVIEWVEKKQVSKDIKEPKETKGTQKVEKIEITKPVVARSEVTKQSGKKKSTEKKPAVKKPAIKSKKRESK